MERRKQTLEEIVEGLTPLQAGCEDETSLKAIKSLTAWPIKKAYTFDDIERLLISDFKIGLLILRLFLGISDDEMETALKDRLGVGGTGINRFRDDRNAYLIAFIDMGVLEAMAATVNHPVIWSDILVERLRSGRGKAIRGLRRGRNLEDFVEIIVKEVFGAGNYETRCKFIGKNGKTAKCDFAIPTKQDALILIEAKGYGATGSKMTDVIGDLTAIIEQKRHDTTLIFFTDGITWKRRMSDLKKIVAMQNDGSIARVYTSSMVNEFKEDLNTLKAEHGI